MAYSFGDGFDHYAANSDPLAGYWDGGTTGGSPAFVAGRFPGGQCVRISTFINGVYIKSSGQNDAVHHINVAFRNNSTVSGTNAMLYFQLSDGATNQCCVVFRSDGAILLTSATPAGTTLATYTGAAAAINVWFAFEFEVVIHPTAGRFRVRKNGNTSDDFDSGAVLNTRPGANSYANKITLGTASSPSASLDFDEFLWRSDASSVTWAGDIRCYTRMPQNDASAQFAKSSTILTQLTAAGSSAVAVATNTTRYTSFISSFTGTIGTATLQLFSATTCNMKCSLFASSGAAPTTVLGSATPLALSAALSCTFTFGTPVAVVKGTQYWIGFDTDAVITGATYCTPGNTHLIGTTVYASFPVASPTGLTAGQGVISSVVVTVSNNADFVSESQQDSITSYVYDSVVGHADLYNVVPLGSTPSSILMVTTLGFMEKSDAGARGAAMQLKSGGTITTAWNPADQVNTTLSSGNLTTAFTGVSTNSAARSTYSASSGKYYFEVRHNAPSNPTVGIGLGSVNLTTLYGTFTGCLVYQQGYFLLNNVSTIIANVGTPVNGDILCVAVDLTAKLAWFRLNGGNWNNSGTANPTTGTGGVDITSICTGPLYAVCGGQQTSGFTANFGATAFAQTMPSGFAGFGSGGTTVQSTPTLLSTSFTYLWRNDVLNPNGNVAWTAAAVDALQFGPVVTS